MALTSIARVPICYRRLTKWEDVCLVDHEGSNNPRLPSSPARKSPDSVTSPSTVVRTARSDRVSVADTIGVHRRLGEATRTRHEHSRKCRRHHRRRVRPALRPVPADPGPRFPLQRHGCARNPCRDHRRTRPAVQARPVRTRNGPAHGVGHMVIVTREGGRRCKLRPPPRAGVALVYLREHITPAKIAAGFGINSSPPPTPTPAWSSTCSLNVHRAC